MEIVVHSKNYLFQWEFQKKLHHFNRYELSAMSKIIQLEFRSQTKNLTRIPSVESNSTQKLWLIATPTLQPC